MNIQGFPLSAGCYLFRDAEGLVLYVGKSKCLRRRVASYFHKKHDDKFAQMMRYVSAVDYISTETDVEAMLLEYRLIKQHRPQYNARMRKDRLHWFILADTELPRLYICKQNDINKENKIGPFYSEEYAQSALEIVAEHWRLPTCGWENSKKSPCLRYHFRQCMAPCSGEACTKEYRAAVCSALSFLLLETTPLAKLNTQIEAASEALAYEEAAKLHSRREKLLWLERLLMRIPPQLSGCDFYLWLKSRHEDSFIWAFLRDGAVLAWMRCIVKPNKNKKEALQVDYATFDQKEGLALCDAILEIDALRYFCETLGALPPIPPQTFEKV